MPINILHFWHFALAPSLFTYCHALINQMSHFSEVNLEKKLNELTSTQQSIQTLSLWIIHHKKHFNHIIKIWQREIFKANEKRKLTLLYLANDIIQNGRKKAPEYSKEFKSVFSKSFTQIVKGLDDKTLGKIKRVVDVWEERSIYDLQFIKELQNALAIKGKHESKRIRLSPSPIIKDDKILKEIYDIEDDLDYVTTELDEMDDANNVKTIPPVDELIKMLTHLENCPSGDATVREKISKLPNTVSDIAILDKIKGKEEYNELEVRVNEAVDILSDYNTRLSTEMDQRKNVGFVLKAYLEQQQKSVTETEEKIKLYREKLKKVNATRLELQMHLDSLPDFSFPPGLLSPSLTSDEVSTSGLYTSPDSGDTSPLRKLAPLPSPNALFSLDNI